MGTESEDASNSNAPMEISWQFDYLFDSDKLKSLYSKAKRDQWDAEQDIDWDLQVDPSRPLFGRDVMAVFHVPLVQRLSASQQATLRAHLAAHQLSQILHGEQGALMTAGALTHAVPDHQGKLYAATQAMDEARHVEVFAAYIHKLAVTYPMSLTLKRLIDLTLGADSWVKIAIGMNMVVEGLALGTFHNVLAVTECELLRRIMRGVIRDESRHVGFGNLYVADAIKAMHADEREEVADFAFMAIKLMRDARHRREPDPAFALVLDRSGIDRNDFYKSVLEMRASGQKVELPKDQVHPFKHLMMPALVRVGAVTDRSRKRYEAEGIPVIEERSTLERMETGAPPAMN
ncbi:MAG: ferritin-like domain-containing protein [Myxococcales bacterium]|nr:ferritin-like domain-containing protein [Myxococcales bacterium]MDD9965355.1 ferritin-like domain-containing protein [Myxococcales bacterium]